MTRSLKLNDVLVMTFDAALAAYIGQRLPALGVHDMRGVKGPSFLKREAAGALQGHYNYFGVSGNF